MPLGYSRHLRVFRLNDALSLLIHPKWGGTLLWSQEKQALPSRLRESWHVAERDSLPDCFLNLYLEDEK